MRKLINSLVFVALVVTSTNAYSYDSEPEIFIDELVKDAMGTLSDKNISKADLHLININKLLNYEI